MRRIDFFHRGSSLSHDKACLIADGATRSYDEVAASSRAIARLLIADGFAAGGHAAVLSGNSIDAFEAVLGILRADGVWGMANNRAPVGENAYLFNLLHVSTLSSPPPLATRFSPFLHT